MLDSFPSLLIATEFPPNASGGGPAVLRQMLRNWPVDRLFWWSCFSERDARFGQRVAAHRVATIPRRFYPTRKFTRAKSWLLDCCWVPSATRHLRKTLDEFQPQVIWVVPHYWAIPPLAAALPRARIAFHLTLQDYPEMNTTVASFGRKRCRRWAQAVDNLYSAATTRDATSHPMIADLKNRTGLDAAQMMHAGLEPEDFLFLDSRASRPASQIRIAYAGTIHTEPEFALFLAALKDIASALPAPVRIDLFGAHSYQSRPWFDPAWMQEHGNLPEGPLLKALRECTWGFSPMSLSDDNPRYNRFSFPTKFITYLAAGLPVITLGHPENAVVKTASLYRVGICSSSTSRPEISRLLLGALSQPSPAVLYAPEILRCARAEFDAAEKRALLYQCLRLCASHTLRRAEKELETPSGR